MGRQRSCICDDQSASRDQDLARSYARDVLAGVAPFRQMASDDQLALYRQLYKRHVDRLTQPPARAFADPKKASDLIDDKRHLNQRIDQAGDLAGDFIDEIDFPKFVRDLLKGVFDANLEVTLKQMEAFQKLLKTATALGRDVHQQDRRHGGVRVPRREPARQFSLGFPDDGETDENGEKQPALTDKEGNKIDLGDNEVKAKIMDAKIAMAKEQRAMLREVILMGVTRLVVEKGVVKAACKFDIKASEKIDKADKAALQEASSTSTSLTASGGLLGSIFGGPKAGHTSSTQKSKISVSSAKSQATTDLTAQVSGSVEIKFKSDYFKLDNFATMYGPMTGTPRRRRAGSPVCLGRPRSWPDAIEKRRHAWPWPLSVPSDGSALWRRSRWTSGRTCGSPGPSAPIPSATAA